MFSSPAYTVDVMNEPGAARHHSAVTPHFIDWLLRPSCWSTLTTLTQYCSISGKSIGSVAGALACGLDAGVALTPLLPAATTCSMPESREAAAICSKVAAMPGSAISASW